jgi:hypothetical protein
MEVALSGNAFSHLAKGGGGEFGTSMLSTVNGRNGCGVGLNFKTADFFDLQLYQVVGIVIGLAHRASRSSEMIWVASMPP